MGWADLGTDGSTIYIYFDEGKTDDALALLAMVGLNMLVQLLLVYLQNRKNSELINARECGLVVTNLKPAVDGIRVIRGMESNGPIDYFSEMTVTKVSELGCEAIPGAVYQLKVYLKNDNKTTFPLISISMSMLSNVYAVFLMFYDPYVL